MLRVLHFLQLSSDGFCSAEESVSISVFVNQLKRTAGFDNIKLTYTHQFLSVPISAVPGLCLLVILCLRFSNSQTVVFPSPVF